ncbi:type II toxin-antitoxin system VapC family toxin [Natronorubrum daqingense]|uniref:Ribonuclease VapC n=1 Tax=Natronorubrum daqingense TaxID=588898 RepID=A0A1N7BSB3_9EURY|nr:PIN domain-containing protein [Natronorubrum daqingense]APX96582.1 VapC toxin family PIN domain ribonuclease [Natronorubrum daqingense]SIR54279.1 Predicted nucleic acid-binding protein, contains PIN domain [Natronorubrum daqingense]
MIFLDSWVWLEFVFDGDSARAAEAAIERADSADEGGLITPTVLAEVSYRIRTVEDERTADDAIQAIHAYEHIESVPLIDEIGEYAAALRFKYYEPGERELSYADTIHLATAAIHDDCHTLYSGDPDFADLEELETVIL